MPVRMRTSRISWMTVLAAAGVLAGTIRAEGAPGTGPIAAPPRTIEWPGFPLAAATASASGAAEARSQATAAPLQGPLNVPTASGHSRRHARPIRPVHLRRLAPRAAPILVAAAPVVPFVPVYVYPPPLVYRPVVPVYAVRPFFYRPFYRSFYRPFFYRPYFYNRSAY